LPSETSPQEAQLRALGALDRCYCARRMKLDSTPVDARSRAAPGAGPTRAEWLGVAVLFFFALGLRLLHLAELRAHDPFFELPSVDPRMYHLWALEILGGDWLGDRVFLNGPLYPYFLAGVYAVAGPSLLAAKAAQCVVGALSCVLVWAVSRRVFDRRVALLAGAITAVYEMLVFYEGTLVVANIQVPLALLGVLLVLSIGVDYAIFLVASGPEAGTRAATLLGLCLACASTCLAFGLLAFSSFPALRALGLSTSIGAVLSLVMAPTVLLLLGPREDAA